MFTPLVKAFQWLPAAVEGMFFTVTWKSANTRPPLQPWLLSPPISHSPTSLNQHRFFPATHPLPLMFPVPGIPSPQIPAVFHSIKPLSKCHPLKDLVPFSASPHLSIPWLSFQPGYSAFHSMSCHTLLTCCLAPLVECKLPGGKSLVLRLTAHALYSKQCQHPLGAQQTFVWMNTCSYPSVIFIFPTL